MAGLAPPPAPPVLSVGDNDGLHRFRMRLMQVMATIWLCTLGAIPAILGLMVAKHVLVAILVMGLGVDAPPTARI